MKNDEKDIGENIIEYTGSPFNLGYYLIEKTYSTKSSRALTLKLQEIFNNGKPIEPKTLTLGPNPPASRRLFLDIFNHVGEFRGLEASVFVPALINEYEATPEEIHEVLRKRSRFASLYEFGGKIIYSPTADIKIGDYLCIKLILKII